MARATFAALECRDFARVDLRMAPDGKVYVCEVNPLPGLTPDYSDLVLISNAVGMTYDQLIAEIMVGGLRRLRVTVPFTILLATSESGALFFSTQSITAVSESI